MANACKVEIFYGSRTLPTLKEWPERPHWNQVHGIHCVEVTEVGQQLGDADALWTRFPNLKIGVRTADCIPILLAWTDPVDKKVKAVGTIHSGWRGALERIVEHFFIATSEALPGIENWSAWIGPSIRACCYEVGPDLISRFVTEFYEISPTKIEPENRRLDLVAITVSELRRLGVRHIELHPDCTFCSEKYFSYRKGDRDARQYSIISFYE